MRYFGFFLAGISTIALGQSNYAPLNDDYYHRLDRYEIRAGRVFDEIFTAAKPYKRSDIVHFLDTVESLSLFESQADAFNNEYFRNDNWEWARPETNDSRKPWFNTFYKKKSDLFYVDEPDFDLHVNPVLFVGAGTDSQLDEPIFYNTRGVEVRGMVDRKVGFYTYFTDNQARLPSYVQEYQSQYWVIPHEGFWKSYGNGGVDFLQARGYITFDATKHINVQFGYDRFFYGNGVRSLILSDFPPPAFFLKGAVKVWKLNYVFSLSQVKAEAGGSENGSSSNFMGYANKFTAFHHLSLNIGRKVNIGLFESIVFSSDDVMGTGEFEFAYLNPIIFFRAIEQQNGSSDNVLLGLDFKVNAIRDFSVYGQFVLDEFLLENLREGSGWWANKWGLQLGVKYIDALGISNLDLQLEGNLIRPYAYSHNTPFGSYTSFLQPMAHPLGANLKEVIGIARYQPLPRLTLKGVASITHVGRDDVGENWGGDILKLNNTREREFGNEIAQGNLNKIYYLSFTASWMARHNLFIDGQLVGRRSKSMLAAYDSEAYIATLALRWNLPQRDYHF
ncbi:MAG: hypothetical protein DIU61_006535 [Bacteroidota bacterium]|nr:MAG: hypothetical protein DIU61_15510 [Bacteroidota bacterium]